MNIIYPELKDTRLLGAIGQRLEAVARQRMLSQHARNVIYQEAADAFANKLDDQSGVIGVWQGEFWGKLVISACRFAAYDRNEDLKEFLRRKTLELITLQQPNGYLGTYRNQLFLKPADVKKAKEVVGWECNWNWNVWCRKYTLWGLLEVYQLTGEKDILQAARKLADNLLNQLQEAKVRLQDTGTFNGLPSCSIIKPMLILHDLVPDQKYLDLAIQAAEAFDDPTGRIPNLIANARSGKPIHQWYPHSESWAKAYEMMSVLDGFCHLTRVTGNPKYLQTAQELHRLIKTYELNTVKAVAYNDVFNFAAECQNAISEPCDHVHWMRLNFELFTLTGNLDYAEDFEQCYLNAFQAATTRDGSWGARGVRSQGQHMTAVPQAHLKHNHCCINNIPRGFLNAAQMTALYDTDGKTLILNLYTPYQATLNTPDGAFQVTIGGSYRTTGQVDLAIRAETSGATRLALRIPKWSRRTTVQTEDAVSTPPPGTYCLLAIRPNQTNRFSLQFDMTPVFHEHAGPFHLTPPEDWKARRWTCTETPERAVPYELMLQKPKCTLTIGPTIMARSKVIGNTEDEMFGPQTLAGKQPTATACPVKPTNVTIQFKATITCRNRTFSTELCDYGSAADDMPRDPRHFSIFF